jgi:hypothetical protein
MESYEARPARGPWWIVGQSAVGAVVLLLAQAGLLVLFIARIVTGDGQWWDWAAAVVSTGVIVASVASVVWFARRG